MQFLRPFIGPTHVSAATPVLKLSLLLTAILGALAIGGGIVAIIWGSVSPTEIHILGMNVKTGNVGVAFTALGIIALIAGIRSVNKNLYKLAALPPEKGKKGR
jgi:hypothetical protein